MSSKNRGASGRRRVWGRGSVVPGLETLEPRKLMTASRASAHPSSVNLPDLVSSAVTVNTSVADWGTQVNVVGKVTNQGGGAVTSSIEVELYASPYAGVGHLSVPIGSVTIPAGLAAGASVPYSTTVTLPSAPVSDVSSNGGDLYIAAWVNPQKAITESNYRNDKNTGFPYGAAELVIEPPNVADLEGTTLAVSSATPTWGSSITVTAQITNDGSGTSPQTRAQISLTPQGIGFGTWSTVGVGNIEVPPLAPYQTVNLVQTITLPAVSPNALTNYTNFTLSMTQDADYLTNDTYPHEPTNGVGQDQTPITIGANPDTTATAAAAPDLAASSLITSVSQVAWGSSFQINTNVENLGPGNAGQFQVRYVLVGLNGSTNQGIYLGSTTVTSLAAGANDPISQTLKLPSRLPAGMNIANVGYARIEAIVDPDNVTNDPLTSNNTAESAPMIVRLPGNTSTVPTTNAANSVPALSTVQEQSKLAAKAVKRSARIQALLAAPTPAKVLHVPKPKTTDTLSDKGVALAKELYKLPTQVFDAIKKTI